MRRHSERRAATSMLGAVMLGFGTVLQPKVHPDDHWSASPKIELVTEVAGDRSAGP